MLKAYKYSVFNHLKSNS